MENKRHSSEWSISESKRCLEERLRQDSTSVGAEEEVKVLPLLLLGLYFICLKVKLNASSRPEKDDEDDDEVAEPNASTDASSVAGISIPPH